MKISCCMIVRDDAHTLRAALESVRPYVDELIVVDTGSTDESPQIAREFATRWELFLGCNDEQGRIEDFALARNYSFSLATGDWVIWIDADDVLVGGEYLRRVAEQQTADSCRILFPYEYAHDDAGAVTCLQYRERLMRPVHRLEWRSPVHEVCLFVEPVEGTAADEVSDLVRVVHQRERFKKPREADRNLRILKAYSERVGESDPRALYYLGSEYAMRGDTARALPVLRRYIELEPSGGAGMDQRCKAMLEVGGMYAKVGDHQSAVDWFLRAMVTRAWPEPFFALGRSFYMLARPEDLAAGKVITPDQDYNLRRAAHWIQRGLELPNDPLLFTDPTERLRIHVILNACLSAIGDLDGAIKSCEEGLRGLPNDEGMARNLAIFRAEKVKRAVLEGVSELFGLGSIDRAQATILRETLNGSFQLHLLDGQGAELEAERAVIDAQFAEPGKLDLVFYLGHGVEPWSPKTFEAGGMGGSETMAWEMAKRLRKLGHRVRLYGHATPSMEGIYEGVEWLDASRYRGVTCDVLIASRRPDAVDDVHNLKAGARVLWVHDVHCGELLDMKRSMRFDRILCLSEWHREYFLGVYPLLDKAKVHVTRNGIDLTRFEGSEPRNPHRAVYSSSPDRGLLTALECWPRIREQVPDAELHVFYGFKNWETVAQSYGDTANIQNIAHLKHLLKTTPGVVFRDRVSQRELAREFMRAGVWAYPTFFSETSCITAMEAQAAGLYIVTSKLAALNETVDNCGMRIDWEGDARRASAEYAERFVGHVVSAMTNPEPLGIPRDGLRAEAKRFGLDSLASDWSEMLSELHADVTDAVVPKFVEVAVQ
jgi:glycosyltransferase involved in cell wall biosynthesis